MGRFKYPKQDLVFMVSKIDIFKDWDLKPDELNEIINANPSLRGFLFG